MTTLGPEGIEALYRSHGHLALRRARHLLGADDLAQEALQEVFASLLRAPQTVRHEGALVGWLYQATTHYCLNQLRNKRSSVRLLAQAAPPAVEAIDGSGDAVEALQDVRRLLERLPDQEASAVIYYHLDGMTHDEVAGMLGCSRRQVGYLLERATKAALEVQAKEQHA